MMTQTALKRKSLKNELRKTIKKSEVLAEARKENRAKAKARREIPKAQEVGDIQDDVLAIVRNSGLSHAEIAAAGGACGSTLLSWTPDRFGARKVTRPQLGTIRGTLRAVGYDLYTHKEGLR